MKEFQYWRYLSEELEYKFFAGEKELYKKNIKGITYVPAVKESVAAGMVSGARLSGVRGGVVIDSDRLYVVLDHLLKLNIPYKIPFLIIVYGEINTKILNLNDLPHRNFKGDLKNVKFIVNKLEKEGKPGFLVIGEGDIE